MSLISYDQFTLPHSPQQIAHYITNAEKVKAYYPFGLDAWQLSDQQILCKGLFGNAFIEQVEQTNFASIAAGYDSLLPEGIAADAVVITTQVFGLFKADPNKSIDALRASAFFTMFEDWILAPCEQGTKVTKTWRDLDKHQLKLVPLAAIVKHTGKSEQKKLLKAWA